MWISFMVAVAMSCVAMAHAEPQNSLDRTGRRESVRLSGFVRSRRSAEVVRHATVFVDSSVVSTASNEEGFYSLSLLAGRHVLHVRAIGYQPFDTTLAIAVNTVLDLRLETRAVALPTVSIQDARSEPAGLDPRAPDPGVIRLDLPTVRLAPVVLGEHDVLRSLTLLPGITTVNDATTSLNVRGGGTDQNLILLDEATLYNPSHVLGFLSAFNADAVDEVTVYKGSMPARYGGRLSSVVDVRQRDGNANAFGGSASLGLLASRLLVEGPLPNDEGSFMVAGRRSYADLFLRGSSDPSTRNEVAYFYDFNAKATIRLGQTGSLLVSGYRGRDRFARDTLDAAWGNAAGTVRWNRAFRNSLFSSVTAIADRYDYHLGFPVASTSIGWSAGISSIALKADESFRVADHNLIEFGAEIARETLEPGRVVPTDSSPGIPGREIETRHAIAGAAYLGHEVDVGHRLSLRYGLRFSTFERLGPATTLRYANDAPLIWNETLGKYEKGRVVDTVRTRPGTPLNTFGGAEPRIAVRWGLTQNSSVKASYTRTRQYLQLATRTNSPTPLDVWEPAGPFIKPQAADQVSIGYTALAGVLEVSAETYFKRLYRVVDFIDGADIILKDDLETALVQGEGRDYGLEIFGRRRAGPVTGWISYTLSRAEQRFPAPSATGAPRHGGINDGHYYPSPSDKSHDLSAVLSMVANERWTFSIVFALASGLPATYPIARYIANGTSVAEYGPRNAERLPLYHRLDLGATRTFASGSLQFVVFNAYNHFNAQSVFFRQSQPSMTNEAVEVAVFRLVPSVAYTWRF
jgi:hypothetical protein